MPKKSRTFEEVEAVKQNILNTALELISKDGFDGFSMRKLAAKLNITATTIYQYFAGKDELYLAVLTKGFGELHNRIDTAYQVDGTPTDKLKRVIREFIRFGIDHSNFYNIMFGWNIPKFNDYLGTQAEPVAAVELETAMRVWELFKAIVNESQLLSNYPIEDREIITFQLLCNFHGLVAFNNSKLIDYLLQPPQADLDDKLIDYLIDLTINNLAKR